MKTVAEALAWLRKHRIVMQAAKVEGVPSLAHEIIGGPFKGSWWGHPKGKLIWVIANELEDTGELVALKLIEGKTTYVHKSLWPALLRVVTDKSAPKELRKHIASVHTKSGKHVKVETEWKDWAKEHGVKPLDGTVDDAWRALAEAAGRALG